MATPGVLRLLETLADGTVEEFSPVINEEGEVSYPDVEQHLDANDPDAYSVLESLARRDILYREFREKAYVCPECGRDGMRYTTVCAECGSQNTIEQELYKHVECGCLAPEEQFRVGEGEYACPDCQLAVRPEQMEVLQQHVCQTCGESAAGSVGALRCRECLSVCEPHKAIEWVLYSYGFEQYGRQWLTTQLSARQALAEMLDERGFTVEVDAYIRNDSTETPVHLYGEDDLLGDRVIGAVHERPEQEDVERLHTAAAAVDARSVLVSTSGTVTKQAEELAQNHDIGLLSYQQDGSLEREYTTATRTEHSSSMLQRLTSSVRRQLN
ncbi:TFIIB-type zinc ribbon-containing protein [Halocatena pleomorpha]|uniref:TFIIB-type zinc ribbon-containing protein n=2 Tax=Halocatena pleomorpha TaxID=1785090 RepID=A0A3P3RA18_9EURY|nr:TFIIB-type zinc ribbon-containing protein [Halocatena pleomorpha]